MRHLFTLMLLLTFCSYSYGQVNKAEYFVDNDPGLGKATAVSFTPGADITTKFNVSLKNVASGFHTLYVRTLDAQGKWSLTNSSIFLNSEITSQNRAIDKAEYFVDTDPGIGKATGVNITPGADVTTKFNAPLNKLAAGFHTFYVRVHDAQGKWSLTNSSIFFNSEITNANKALEKAEYYVDNDPGLGKGTSVTIPAGQKDATINFKVDVKNLSNGVHTLNVRVLDNGKSWSQNSQHIFVVKAGGIENIVSLKYNFTRAGFVSDMNVYPVPTPSPSIDLNFKADLSKLTADQEYTMQIYAVTESGAQSMVQTKKVKVCSTVPSKANFDFVTAGSQVSFINNSTNSNKYQWDFGDGKKDTLSNPFHAYGSIGVYNVKLISSSYCNSDTIVKVVNIEGIKEIYTNHGGNTGSVTVDVKGAGFVAGTKLFLNKNGERITGDTLVIQNFGLMSTTFNLNNKTIGIYDVITVFPSGKSDTLKSGFTVEIGKESNLWVTLNGPNILRIGFNQVYTVTYGNKGNTDESFVPIAIGGLPIGTNIEILNPLVDADKIPGLPVSKYNLDTIRRTIDDSVKNMSFRCFYINKIAAGSTGTLQFIFHLPLTTPLRSNPEIQVLLGQATYKQSDKSKKVNGESLRVLDESSTASSCTSDFVIYAAKLALSSSNILKPYEECAIGLYESYSTIKELFVHAKNSKSAVNLGAHVTLDFFDFNKKYVETTFACVESFGISVEAPVFFTTKLTQVGATLFWDALVHYQDIFTCSQIYYKVVKDYFKPTVGNAQDPNQKYGPGDASDNHYTTAKPFSYVINFENLPTANLNAQTVTVTDTLNKNSLDLSSFGFTSVTLGDSTYTLSSPTKSFVHDFDFTSLYKVKARVTANFDATTGVAYWKFFTIDPKTNQITTEALDGFLPPDKIAPKGQGYVSFIVNPKPDVKSGDEIQNKAVIKFDYNPVIVTNTWKNVFDLIKPVSKINALPTITNDSTFTVKWGGTDQGSGIRSYDVYYKTNKGSFQIWQSDAAFTDAKFTGKKDSVYSFYSIAYDNAGNIEDAKAQEEASTTIRIFKPQKITFPAIASKTFGDPDFDPGAIASSALPVTYATNNTMVATVVNGKLHIAGAGTVIITASQSGNQDYTAATPVNDTLLIKKAAQTLTFPTILSKNYNDPDFNPGATSSSGLPVTYSSSNTAVLTLVNGQLHIVTTGTSTITATQAGNANYLAAASISQDIQVIFALPANNFTIGAVSVSCKGSSNGEINMTAASTQNYTATVTSGTTSTTYPFTGQLSVKNLPAGTYSVCVTIASYPAYKQCFDVVVTEPKDLSVYSVVNPTLGTLSLNLSGASFYNITVNSTIYATTQSNITLPLEPGSNTVKVTTASICQGIYEKTIQLPPGVLAYPNPFERILSLSIGNDRSSTATIEVYDIKGQKVYAGKSSINQGKCSLDLGNLVPGSYMLKLILDHSETHLKIIKK